MPNRTIPIDYSILEQLPVGIFITDTDLTILYWNRKLEHWTSKSKQEVVGKLIVDLYPHLNQKNYQIRIRDVVSGGPSVIFSSQLHPYFLPAQLPDGSYRIQNTTLTRNLGLDNKPYLVFTIQDITDTHRNLEKIKDLRKKALNEITERERIQIELHESREMLASINRNISEGIFRILPDIGITYANQALANLLDYKEIDDLMGTNPLTTHIISSNRDIILAAIQQGDRYIYEEVRIKSNTGNIFWAQISITITHFQDKQIRYADCLISDISTKKNSIEICFKTQWLVFTE